MMSVVVASALAAASGASLGLALATRVEPAVRRRLPSVSGTSPDAVGLSVLSQRALARMGSFALARGVGARGLSRSAAIRRSSGVSAETFVGLKITSAIGTAFLVWLVFPGPAALLAMLLFVAAYRVPDIVMARTARRRREAMDAELPQLLDLLAAASHAGLAGPLAFRRAVAATRGPLSVELRGALDAIQLGGRWRDELRLAAERTDLPDLSRAVTALTRTESLGSSLAASMTELAARVRADRRAARTERARKAPVKMLFPLVFLVLPAFLLLTVAPVLFSTLRSID